jgi:hypothetical protein
MGRQNVTARVFGLRKRKSRKNFFAAGGTQLDAVRTTQTKIGALRQCNSNSLFAFEHHRCATSPDVNSWCASDAKKFRIRDRAMKQRKK